MPTILITGSTGYIAGHLVRQLADMGYNIVGVYRTNHLDYGSVEWVKCDLRNNLNQLPTVDYVIHSSTLHPLLEPSPNAIEFLETNVNATLNLANWSKTVGVKKFIMLSTITVHGAVTIPELTEDAPLNTPDLYGMTKYLAEKVLEVFSNNFVVCILRLPGVIGPNIIDLGRPWLSSVLKNAIANNPIHIYNADALYNNLIDVDEIARACVTILESCEKKLSLFNLAASGPIPLRTAVTNIVNAVNSRSHIIESSTEKTSYYINIDRIKDELNFSPITASAILDRLVKNNL